MRAFVRELAQHSIADEEFDEIENDDLYELCFEFLGFVEGARELIGDDPSHWDDDPNHPPEQWKYEVENEKTRLGYLDWVAAQKA